MRTVGPAPGTRIGRALEPALRRWLGGDVRVAGTQSEPYAYGSSHALVAVDVRLEDGRTIPLLLKDTGRGTGRSCVVRPAFVDDREREEDVYRRILGPLEVDSPACLGTIHLPDPARATGDGNTKWLVLERVSGEALYEAGDFEAWTEAARWLGRLHARFSRTGPQGPSPAPATPRGSRTPHGDGPWHAGVRLLTRDAGFHRAWWLRALRLLRTRPDGEAAAAALARAGARFALAVDRVAALPSTFLHGEFYAANIMVRRSGGRPAIVPVDWEMASIGPGLLDLAALTAGSWSGPERDALAEAYREALAETSREAGEACGPTLAESWSTGGAALRQALDDCRLLLAVQWLGWAADWAPPPEQAHDWLGEALSVAVHAEPSGPENFPSPGNELPVRRPKRPGRTASGSSVPSRSATIGARSNAVRDGTVPAPRVQDGTRPDSPSTRPSRP